MKNLAPIQSIECRHCRTRFRPSAEEDVFCCSGCRFVHHLLHKRGLQEFYRYGEGAAPAGSFVFHERDHTWLGKLQAETEAGAGGEDVQAVVSVQGISCAGCVWLLEEVFRQHPGAVACEVRANEGSLRLRWKAGQCPLTAYAVDVQRFGYLLGPAGGEQPSGLRPLARKLGLCGALALNAMLFSLPRYLGLSPADALAALFDLIAFAVATLSIGIGGTYFFRRAWTALRMGALHIDLPISLGLAFAYAGSVAAWLRDQHSGNYFDFVSIFTFLMLLGRWLQERVVEANRQRLLSTKLTPGRVDILREGGREEADPRGLTAGDRFVVTRNRIVPVRAKLLGGAASFALNWITGEPVPRRFETGGIVPSGARNLSDGELMFEALEGWTESRLAALMHIDSERVWHSPVRQGLISVYLTMVLILAGAGFLAWGLGGGGWAAAFQVLISVLVVSCPCAIGVALPLLDDLAAGRMQQHGVYLREGTLWSRLRRVTRLLLDKTGTVTLENLRLADRGVLGSLTGPTRSHLLRLVERSLHPVAACLREELLAAGTEPAEGSGTVMEKTGLGLEWESELGRWRLGRASWAANNGQGPGTVLSLEGSEITRFHFREELRPDAARQVSQLQSAGLSVYLLSGDEQSRVTAMARALGLPDAHALGGLSPEEKAGLVRSRWSGNALMLGDGANDSLAFDASLCRGTPAVDTGLLEHKADFYLLGRGLGGLGALFSAAHRHHVTTRAVVGFAVTYNAAAVSVSLAGWMSPLVAAIIMPLSSLASIGIVLLTFRVFSEPKTPTSSIKS